MSDLIIVKSGANIKPDLMDYWHKEILKQKETGVIVLPWYFDAVVVPEDVEIKIGENPLPSPFEPQESEG